MKLWGNWSPKKHRQFCMQRNQRTGDGGSIFIVQNHLWEIGKCLCQKTKEKKAERKKERQSIEKDNLRTILPLMWSTYEYLWVLTPEAAEGKRTPWFLATPLPPSPSEPKRSFHSDRPDSAHVPEMAKWDSDDGSERTMSGCVIFHPTQSEGSEGSIKFRLLDRVLMA